MTRESNRRISNPPNAKSLMMTARSFGNYDLAGAIADLIDNSIKANSTRISITCIYKEADNCEVRINDNGDGMTELELIDAMRPASTDPTQERAPDDLGRFGWGMKSASFSQAKILTVITQKDGKAIGARWNLDDIDGWHMDVFDNEDALSMLREPLDSKNGTELIWNNCDRLTENGTVSLDEFNKLIVNAREKLALIFHRYLAGQVNNQKLTISVNGTPLDYIDPFCTSNPATQPFAEEPIKVPGLEGDSVIGMKAYVLPHFNKLTGEEYEQYGGREGYTKNQGFYVYRNKRLIIWGTWFLLAKHGELSKLVRIRVDIPNTLDDMWKITVDKSDAQLPAVLKNRMKKLIAQFRNSSSKVFRSRGAKIDKNKTGSVWERRVRNQMICFKINREHPLLDSLLSSLPKKHLEDMRRLIEVIETEVPIDTIISETGNNPHSVQQGMMSREDVIEFTRATLPKLMEKYGSPSALFEGLKETEPYASNWNVIEEILKEMRII